MGITEPIDAVPSICLGTPEISVCSMVGAYCTYANKGIWVQPTFVTRIEDKNGRVLEQLQPKTDEAMSPQDAYVMLNMMEGVVDYGTGARLRWLSISSHLLMLLQVKRVLHKIILMDGLLVLHLTLYRVAGLVLRTEPYILKVWNMGREQGKLIACMGDIICKKFMPINQSNLYQGAFEKPDKPLTIELDCEKYKTI